MKQFKNWISDFHQNRGRVRSARSARSARVAKCKISKGKIAKNGVSQKKFPRWREKPGGWAPLDPPQPCGWGAARLFKPESEFHRFLGYGVLVRWATQLSYRKCVWKLLKYRRRTVAGLHSLQNLGKSFTKRRTFLVLSKSIKKLLLYRMILDHLQNMKFHSVSSFTDGRSRRDCRNLQACWVILVETAECDVACLTYWSLQRAWITRSAKGSSAAYLLIVERCSRALMRQLAQLSSMNSGRLAWCRRSRISCGFRTSVNFATLPTWRTDTCSALRKFWSIGLSTPAARG